MKTGRKKTYNLLLETKILEDYNRQRPESVRAMACWAPTKNLFLGMRGKVMTCCYNKTYLLGNYPEESLHSIWFGEKRKNLVNTIKENDFSLGCQGCYEAINAGNTKGLTSLKFDHLVQVSPEYPTRIDFELSNECNLECKMCRGEFSSSIRRNVEKLPAIPSPYGDKLLKELEEFIPYLTDCHFLGGEPFLISAYLDIWDLIIKINPNIRISIVTNATLLSNRVKKILEKLNCDICVSIDSVDKENYESIRKNARFDNVNENIQYLREYTHRKGTRFNISVCAMTLNVSELPALVTFANTLDCPIFFTRVTYPRELSIQAKTGKEIQNIIVHLRKAILPETSELERKNKETFLNLVNHFEFWSNQNASEVKMNFISFNEYMSIFKAHLEKTGKSHLFNDIEEKLIFIISKSDSDAKRKIVESKIMEIPYHTLTEMVPGISKEHLLHLFNSFVTPVTE